jgi:hypothetical protein
VRYLWTCLQLDNALDIANFHAKGRNEETSNEETGNREKKEEIMPE